MGRGLALLAVLLAAACGNGSADVVIVDAGDAAREPGDAAGIPGPGAGHQVNVAFVDVEPNDTPEQATPLGVAVSGNVIPWVANDKVGGASNPADYFVFESGPVPALFEFDMCYSAPLTGLSASLWKVQNGVELVPPIAEWTLSTSCAPGMGAPLDADSEYLFGVLATGGPGLYTA